MGKSIADLVENAADDMGHRILTMYGRKAPEYAVYRTEQRVLIQYADDTGQASNQRRAMAPLNPLRGEITGWIDGWRRGRPGRQLDAERYDLRVAGALILAFEGDIAAAQVLLGAVKQDILDERVALARFQYVLCALVGASVVVLAALLARDVLEAGPALTLWRGAGAGATGAFFSIAIALHGRTVLPDLQWLSNALDAVLRVLIGTIAGAVLVGLTTSHAVTLSLGNSDPTTWLSVLTAGFLAGFSERFVQDLLAKVEVKAKSQPAPSVTGPGTKPGGAGGAATTLTPPPADGKEADDADLHAEEAGVDHCLGDVTAGPGEVTPDHELPAAAGGIAKPQ